MDLEDPLWNLYEHVRRYETPAGIALAEPFLTLPSKRDFPSYYEVIEQPISMNEVMDETFTQHLPM